MTLFFLVSLFVFGTLFGSFASVLIWRIKSGEGGIATGRSHCGKCRHMLGVFDLVPIFSWAFLGGKCRYCREWISPVYPLLELTMGALFALSGYVFIDFSLILAGSYLEMARLGLFLGAAFVAVTFVYYDILFMEIPDEVILPFLLVLLTLLSLDTWGGTRIFSHFQPWDRSDALSPILDGLLGAWIIYTFFYLQILIPGILHAVREKKPAITKALLIEYFIMPVYVYIHLFSKKNHPDEEHEEPAIPAWIGGGDLRIAIFMGLLAGTKGALLGLLLSYFAGSIIGIAILLRNRDRNTEVPFGPYLALGLYISLFWYAPIVDWYTKLLTF